MTLLKKLQELFKGKNGFILTEEFQQILNLIQTSNQNLFITGKAGTGKSTLIELIRNHVDKKIVVLAPTGLSAINVRGQTIHSFFHLPPRLITRDSIRRLYNDRIFKDIDTVIIDEISMVRADVIDGIDHFLRIHGKDRNLPFGGIQMIFVGDLYQLPPILRQEESHVYYQLYDTPYFFSASAFNERNFIFIELTQIFRQKDEKFVNILNSVRVGTINQQALEPINARFAESRLDRNKYITLTTTNAVANSINESELNKINQLVFTYAAEIEGDFPTTNTTLPVELELHLKKGARVMFVKNDKGRMWVNGTLGTVHALKEDSIEVKIEENNRSEIVTVSKEKWENIKYDLDDDTNELKEKVMGTLTQYPLRLAWAITIHKSQGMTFEKVNIDFTKSPFAHGQTYVALSRCRTIEGIVLSKKIWPNDVIVDERIIAFSKRI
ncbi:MAG TPA: DEAD/DEAH box helicase [Candidatus Saccharimonadales bacterium]|nr:DEAD/DEAH box helicase [Candidatus Saccharimonadales bacterium]